MHRLAFLSLMSPQCCSHLEAGLGEVTWGFPHATVPYATPSDSQATELFPTLVSELQGLSVDELMGLWQLSSSKSPDNR